MRLSPTGEAIERFRWAWSLYRAQQLLQVYTLAWLVHCAYNYTTVSLRPEVLFGPEHWFGRLFMPQLPEPWVFYGTLIVTAGVTVWVLWRGGSVGMRLIQVLLLLYVNLPLWSYGFASHVSHLFLLAHLFGVFIQWRRPVFGEVSPEYVRSLQLYLLGLLLTYGWSGAWKVVGLVYKFGWQPGAVNWLHPDAALLNAIVSFRNYDEALIPVAWIAATKPFWIFGFFVVLYIQLLSPLGAFRLWVHPWLALGLVIFHYMNIVAFHTHFYTAPILVVLLLWPYWRSKACQAQIPSIQVSQLLRGTYTRRYENGDEDVYQGRYAALLGYWQDKGPWLAGLLAAPLLGPVLARMLPFPKS